jgi:type VI secretion system protein ImpM
VPDGALSTPPGAGWYGKIAALGDFAQRRMADDWVGLVDGWLARAMHGARSTLGERWLDVYLSAPVLRFGWAPGVVDSRWWFGVAMPSCDAVGRYFPLVVAEARARVPEDRIALDHLELWFEHLGRAALATLADGDGGSLDAFERALADAPPWPTPGRDVPLAPTGARGTAVDGDEEARYAVPTTATLANWSRALAAQELGSRLHGCSVWWRAVGDGVAGGDTVSVVRGLPDGFGFATLLDGR